MCQDKVEAFNDLAVKCEDRTKLIIVITIITFNLLHTCGQNECVCIERKKTDSNLNFVLS